MSGSLTRIWRLAAVTAGLWLLCAVPAWMIADGSGLEGLTYALLLCLVPGIVALAFAKVQDPRQAPFAVLTGMGLRMASVLAGALVLRAVRPDLGPSAFHVWLIVGYLVALAVETQMLLADIKVTRQGSSVGQPMA
jgi:hypothetical protein